MNRWYSVVRFESMIHEYDPWFNYRATEYLDQYGVRAFFDWYDIKAWYPHGRSVGATVYPGLMFTAVAVKKLAAILNYYPSLTDICVHIAPLFSMVTVVYVYKMTAYAINSRAGLIAAFLMSVVPGYISRSVAGSYDNEAIAITLLISTFYYWLKALGTGKMHYSILAAVSYACMASAWGGYQYITNLVSLHVLSLLFLGRFSDKLYTSFSVFFALGQLLSTLTPYIHFKPMYTSEHYSFIFVMLLVQCSALKRSLMGNSMIVKWHRTVFVSKGDKIGSKSVTSTYGNAFDLSRMLSIVVYGGMTLSFILAYYTLAKMGLVLDWADRFYSLWDSGYAKVHIPLVASISEHQSPAWSNFFFDMHILTLLFPYGLYLSFKSFTNQQILLILYAITALYFSCILVRVILILSPITVILSAQTIDALLYSAMLGPATSAIDINTYKPQKESIKIKSENEPDDQIDNPYKTEQWLIQTVFFIIIGWLLALYLFHSNTVAANSYSSPSIVLEGKNNNEENYYIDDYREAYQWIKDNTAVDANIMSWWDYGYQIQGMADRTTVVDNNTNNYLQISLVALAFSLEEEKAFKILTYLDVDYVIVTYTGQLGYIADDISKLPWMARIAEGDFPDIFDRLAIMGPVGHPLPLDHKEVHQTLKDSLMYKLIYYRMHEIFPTDHARKITPAKIVKSDLKYLREVYTTSSALVRIYKVRKQ